MKYIFTIALLSVSCLYAQDNAILNGKMSNPSTGKCFLYSYETDAKTGKMHRVILDSSDVKSDGTFSMAFNLKEQTTATFYDGNEQTTVLLDSGDDLYLTLNTKMFDETITYTGKGSEKNNAIKNFALMEETINNKIFAYDSNTDTTEIFAYMEKAYSDFRGLIEDYKKDIPELSKYAESEFETVDMNIKQIKEHFAFKIKMADLKGTDAIDFEGVDLKGDKLKISSFQGKITVIDFWATWCGPCKAEMPSFKALEETYGADINFVSVGLWCEKKEWAKMAADFGFKNNMFLGKGEEKQITGYEVKFIPRYIVMDKNLKIIDALAPKPSSGDLQKYFK